MRGARRLGIVVALGAMALGVIVPAWQLAHSGPESGASDGPARAVGTALLPGVGGAQRPESGPAARPVGQASAAPVQLAAARASFARLPLHFEPNQGQMDESVDFMSQGAGHTVYLTPAEAVIALHSKDNPTALQLRLRGANASAESFVTNKLPGHTSYFTGNQPERWHTGIPQYGRAGYHSVYPGIDLVYYGNESGRLEHDFIVAPGADPTQIVMEIDGAESLRLDRNGDLVMQTAAGEVRLQRPVVYQQGAPGREPVAAKYGLRGRTVRFVLGEYDPSRELVIDPVVLYSSFFGGSAEDRGIDVRVGSDGAIYLFGISVSNDLPSGLGSNKGNGDYFIAKLDATASVLTYLAYLGSSQVEARTGTRHGAVDGSGQAYLVGATKGTDYPVTATAYQATSGGDYDGVVSKLNAAGNAILYSTYLGGSNTDVLQAITVDEAGQAYVTGYSQGQFPMKNAEYGTPDGGRDIVVARLDTTEAGNNSLAWSTFSLFDSEADEEGLSLVLGNDKLYFGGYIDSSHVVSRSRQVVTGNTMGCIMEYTLSGSLQRFHSIDSDGDDTVSDLAMLANGDLAFSGSTTSGTLVGLNNPAQAGYGGGLFDAFVGVITSSFDDMPFMTYLGGSGTDLGVGVAVDGQDNLWVVGATDSADFPTTNPSQAVRTGASDGFVAQYSRSGQILFSTYLGGTGHDSASAVATHQGQVIVAGQTDSPQLPELGGAFQAQNNGGFDGFITLFEEPAAPQFTSADGVTFQEGQAETFTVTASGAPRPAITLDGGALPAGITLTDNNDGTATLGGTATELGTFPLTFKATNSAPTPATQTFTLTVLEALRITTDSLPDGTVNAAYPTRGLAAAGGVGQLHWVVSGGDWPAGLELGEETGEVSGTPTQAGEFTFTVTVTDDTEAGATREYTVTIHDALAITTDGLPDWTAGMAYPVRTLAATGGTGTRHWTLNGGALPDGLQLDGDTGEVSGTPTTAGSFTFTAMVIDDVEASATKEFTVTIHEALTITTDELPDWTAGMAYPVRTLDATGGTGTRHWTLNGGTLPDGLQLDGDRGEVSGTPTRAGSFTFTAMVIDDVEASATKEFTVTIHDALAVTTNALPDWTKGLAGYHQTVTATGGTGTLLWTLNGGALPDGLQLDGTTGEVSGTPTQAGSFTFTVMVIDDVEASAAKEFTVTIHDGIAVTTAMLPHGVAHQPGYSQTLTSVGGTAPVTWSIVAGSLPDGLGLNGTTGEISGEPTTVGMSTFTVRATDALNATADRELTLTITPNTADTNQSTATVPNGTAGLPTTITVTARDAQGNLRTAGGDIVVVTVTGANSATAAVVDNGDGTYTATYTPTVAGTDNVAITIGGNPLAASPYTSQVAPGATDAGQSGATVPDGTAGEVTTITIIARDASGNPRTAGGDEVEVTINGANSGAATVTDNGDGTYTVTYTPTVAGTDMVVITINGDPLAASPYSSQVAPGAVSGEQSQVVADRDRLLADGHDAVTLTITLRDAQGNPIAGIDPEDLAAAADPSDGVVFGAWSGATDAAGQASVTATRTVAGEVNFTITASAQQLVDAPHVVFRPVLTFTFPAGLHLLGLPGTPDDPTPLGVLGDPATGWKQARWDPATQDFAYYDQQPDSDLFRFGPGRGQWVRFTTDTTLTMAGEATPDGPFTLPVPEGWSNGANPFGAALPWTLDDIRVRLGGAEVGNLSDAALWDKVRPYLWIYDSANQTSRLVFPGLGDDTVPGTAGFWVKALVDGAELVLQQPAAGRSRARSASTARDWLATLLASGADGLATSVTVGTSSRLAQPLAVERPPVNGATPTVEVAVIATNGSRLAGELQPAAGTFTWDLAVTSRQAGEVNLRWPSLLRDLPAGLILELADQQTGQTVLLNTRAAYRFAATRADESRRLRLTARLGHIDRATITNLSAQANRAGGTTLQLTLSAPAEVQLTVRGLGGRLVRELSQQASAGTVALTWDGLDADGRRVPRGTYQVEATAVSANGAVHRAVRVVTVR